MDPPPLARSALLLLTALACRSPVSEPATLESAVAHALRTLPWDHPGSVGTALCPTLSPCDTIWLEPRIAQLPNPAPAFFVPAARPALKIFEEDPASGIAAMARLRRALRYGGWTECLARRHDPAWLNLRRACVAVGLSGDSLGADTLHFALLVLTPAEGLKWPRVRLVRRPQGGWRGDLVSIGGE